MPILVLANTSLPQLENPVDNINMPNLKFEDAQVSGGPGDYVIHTPWTGNYIESLYGWGVGVIAILSVLTIAIGGVIWVTAAGNQGRITEAKSWIGSSLLGLTLALSSYLILTTINPDLGGVGWISISNVEAVDPGDYTYNTTASYNNSPYGKGTPGQPFPLPDGKFPSPASRDMTSMVNFYLNDVTIQYVSKNDPLIKEKRGRVYGGIAYSDCSAFAAHLAAAGGYNKIDGEGTTQGLFVTGNNNRQEITDIDDLERKNLIKIGDVVGYNDGGVGHTMTYIGNGQLIECTSDDNENSFIGKNGAIRTSNLKNRLSGYLTGKNRKKLYYINR
ncbi:MAG: hypothetical protein V1865_01385 [bacterium]